MSDLSTVDVPDGDAGTLAAAAGTPVVAAGTPGAAARRPLVIGHRGASGYVPEHTLVSYFLALEQGADYIEPDLVSTRDGVLVARHENEIGATTDVGRHPEFAARRTRKVIDGKTVEGWFTEDFTLEELKRLRARERIPEIRPGNARLDGELEIPTLEEILGLVRAVEAARARAPEAVPGGCTARRARIGIYPETKHPTYFAQQGLALEAPLLACLARYGYEDERAAVFIQSFETANLQALRRSTRLKLVQLIEAQGAPFDWRAGGVARTYRDAIAPRGLEQIATYADAVGVEKTLVIPRDARGSLRPPTELTRDAHAAGLEVHAFTFRAENPFLPPEYRRGGAPDALGDLMGELERHLAAGIDGFFVDQPALGVRALDRFLAARARRPLSAAPRAGN
ncbi:MAG: glycerophosphodiester phosphodiesterase [Steroidobacteraceae bacterium]